VTKGNGVRIAAAGLMTVVGSMTMAPAAHASEGSCDRTIVHRIICQAIDDDTVKRVKQILCQVSGDLCL
jgi:hypothetical protein